MPRLNPGSELSVMNSDFEQYMTVTDCPYCHNTDAEKIADTPHTVRCKMCGLYRLFPRMTRDGQIAFVDYHYGALDIREWGNPLERAAQSKWEIGKLSEFFPSVFQDRADVLDVGCGEGGFVAALQQAGAFADGLEPQQRLVLVGREHGLSLHKGRFEANEMPEELRGRTFDLICFRESIYYMPDLQEAFGLLRAYLKPGGRIYVKSHVGTSAYYKLNRDFAKRYSICVAAIPTRVALSRILEREGYHVRGVIPYPNSGFDYLSLGPCAFSSLARRVMNTLSAQGELYLNKSMTYIANALGMGDCLCFFACA